MVFTKILVAIDDSPLCPQVFERALGLAKLNQAELNLFHGLANDVATAALPLTTEMGLSHQMVSQGYQMRSLHLDRQAKQMQLVLQQYCQMAIEQGIAAKFELPSIEPGHGLCQVAASWQADLIVLGRRGRKGISEALLGSVSNYVLHHAPCAVLVIQS